MQLDCDADASLFYQALMRQMPQYRDIVDLLSTLVFAALFVPLDMKRCICHFTKWQMHPFIPKGGAYYIMKRVDYLTSFTVPSSSI